MEEDKGKKKYRYTYYTATGKEEIEEDENWYEILRQVDIITAEKNIKAITGLPM